MIEEIKQTKIKVKLIRSLIGTPESHRATVKGLGLRRINSVSEFVVTPSINGMLKKVCYLIKVIA